MEPIYAPAYRVVDGCLLETRNSRNGPYERKLCNFAPWIVSEITINDGVETTTWIRLRGKHQSGRTLPEIEIPAAELSGFQWLAKHWGMDCILEVGQNVKDALRYAIQTTAEQAKKQMVFTVAGWHKLDGEYHFLMPGDNQHTVTLPGKMHGYTIARDCSPADIQIAAELLQSKLAPEEILWPLMAFAFLTPLNHFLKLAGCEPKFVLFLVGKTGSRKSTLAVLMLSFFGKFTTSELPLSFRDTANSILHHSFALKDVLTCIDDYHPAGRQEEQKLTATAQSIMRAYGDRTGKGRLRADASPMESRPPQGNAIVTAEFPPDIGESGTARYFSLELKGSDVNLQVLSPFQKEAADGSLQRCMYGYLRWLKERFLSDTDTEQKFISMLQTWFQQRRDRFQVFGIRCHGRVPETVAWLQLGMDLLLCFLKECSVYTEDDCEDIQERFRQILYQLAQKQAQSIEEDKPTHKFIRKIYALLESNQAHLLDRADMNSLENQLRIVRAYALEHGYQIVGESYDDNVSGMRFDRKGLNQVTRAVDASLIDAVIVKDLSRLGRHQMQTALFIDYLRQCSVAVISVTEGLNTMNDGDDLIIGVRQIMNDYYARDIGNKIRHGYRQKQKEGLVITPPFGYWKDRNTGRIRLHPEASVTVQIIYELYCQGLGQKEITRRLNAMQRKTPKQIRDERWGKAGGKVYRWTYQSVKNVLSDESYTGVLINHQTKTHNRTVTDVPKTEQYRHEKYYPVIIQPEEWRQAQALLKANLRPYRGNTASHRYAGLLTCGDCGSTFVPRIRTWNGNRRVEYLCKSYMHHGKDLCPSHRIRETELDAQVQQYAEAVRNQWIAEQADLQRLYRKWSLKQPALDKAIAQLREEIRQHEEEIDELLMLRIQSTK